MHANFLVSYLLAAVAGICFIQGLAVLSNGRRQLMETFERFIEMLDYSLDTKSKRHIAGGILLSISLLFGGLAFTAMTMKGDKE